MSIKASNNLIHINAHQMAALLTRQDNRFVSVAGANGTGRELIVRLLGTLMQEFNPKWVPMYCHEKADVVPAFDLPVAHFVHSNQPVPLVPRFVEYDDNRDYTVSRATLDDIEFDDLDAPGVVMVIKDPDAFVPRDGTSFQIFTQFDGFIYTTGLSLFEGKDGEYEIRTSSMMQRSLVRQLAQPLSGKSHPTPIDLWMEVQYQFMAGCQEFFNRYLGEGETPWEPIEDFRSGDELHRLIETNCFPPNANALMTTKKKRLGKKDTVGAEGTEALRILSAVTDLEFTPVPERYNETPIVELRIAQDPEVAAEFVCYIRFKMPDDAIEEQVVISGNDFSSLYLMSIRLGDNLRVKTVCPDALTSAHFE